MNITGMPIACTQIWKLERSTSSRSSSGNHGFVTMRISDFIVAVKDGIKERRKRRTRRNGVGSKGDGEREGSRWGIAIGEQMRSRHSKVAEGRMRPLVPQESST
ncbi:hypothetical protein Salat_2787300 [Sesamum alatum]|uniref:Uncharacterized protein n=1 Tax=Sesamum alatum TaxID=300844 RepID=A0AAE1XKQ8_9LAMI|nr:hypothetical protein Salat_2787300 [Sesamum alatum]